MTVQEQNRQSPLVASRESVGEIVRALHDPSVEKPPLNVAEVLELLIDAGQFVCAQQLSESVAGRVSGDGRDRLFRGYATLCELMQSGKQDNCLETLETLYIEIHNGGHSVPDKVRIGLLLARAIALCVSVGSLSERSILRCRNILSVELDRLALADEADIEAQVVTDLAKCYLYAPTPDPRAAHAIVSTYVASPKFQSLSASRSFDVMRALFQSDHAFYEESEQLARESLLREHAQKIGVIACALAELSIARKRYPVDLERLNWAAEIFESNNCLSGAFEANFVLATHAFDRSHNVVAEKYWGRALAISGRGGFLHGELLALLGLFQCSLLGEESKKADSWLHRAQGRLCSELAVGSAGLNVAAAQQMVGDFTGALSTATRCESFFKDRQMSGFQAQAANIVATCEARAGNWKRAGQAWKRAAALDLRRHAFVTAAERHGLIAQTILMDDMAEVGHARSVTLGKVDSILSKADGILESFGGLEEASRVRARLHGVRAHAKVLSGEHVSALRHFASAREIYNNLGLSLDVAMTDALTALSMLEVGKSASPGLAEESVIHLQRALHYFVSQRSSSMTWKILYYMSVAAVVVSQSKTAERDKEKWKSLAVAWIEEAEREFEQHKEDPSHGEDADAAYVGFAPGVTKASIRKIKKVLGLRDGQRRSREQANASFLDVGDLVH